MKVIYTDQAIESLGESIRFYREEQEIPQHKVDELITRLFDRGDSLEDDPYIGQYEEYLEHLKLGHRRIIEGYFKIIYIVKSDHISVTDFFDTRQDPETMKG